MWHASIAAHSAHRVTRWEHCGLKLRAIMRDYVMQLIAGVGTGETKRERSDTVLHARRMLAPVELELLTAEWCAIPAVGIAGKGVPW